MNQAGERSAGAVDMYHPLVYRIHVRGRLDPAWHGRVSGMSVSVSETSDGSHTTLDGTLVDQTALQGVLKTLYDLGMTVVSVTASIANTADEQEM